MMPAWLTLGTHGGLIDSTQKVIEEVRGVEESGWPGVAMVMPLQVAEESTNCVCMCVESMVHGDIMLGVDKWLHLYSV